jgi:hypothetical protein
MNALLGKRMFNELRLSQNRDFGQEEDFGQRGSALETRKVKLYFDCPMCTTYRPIGLCQPLLRGGGVGICKVR